MVAPERNVDYLRGHLRDDVMPAMRALHVRFANTHLVILLGATHREILERSRIPAESASLSSGNFSVTSTKGWVARKDVSSVRGALHFSKFATFEICLFRKSNISCVI